MVLVVEPSPKFQKRLVMVPVDESVKVTVKGLRPLVGEAVNAAAGTTAPVPSRVLVLFPALLVVTTTTLLKLPAAAGVKRMTRFVERNPAILNGELGETIENGPELMVTTALLRVVPPVLLTVRLTCLFVPTATVPKLVDGGNTTRLASVRPVPVTVRFELPPLLTKVTTLLKLPAVCGAKLIGTGLVVRPRMANGVPDWTANGWTVVTVPVRVRSPVFPTWKFRILVWPMVIE